ncbi:hypothetical protein ISN45_At04g005610 [Arabidopsis thaliana x Arabidopsis arenosa]|uniref:Uncharacterized protein n=1 Tax=Arabidopsis thaliana x Arabidopsis arenosa TaxID=1240361 RepID=A0A8T2DV84_9BRAS|nr:hypothetical protein ISN45_At04g005610 [Arabidopsis thaliana x Arabidopsis arenosa]
MPALIPNKIPDEPRIVFPKLRTTEYHFIRNLIKKLAFEILDHSKSSREYLLSKLNSSCCDLHVIRSFGVPEREYFLDDDIIDADDEGVITTDDDDSDTDRHWEDWEEYQLIEDMKKQQVNDSDTSSSSDEDDVKSGKEKLGEQATRSLSTLGVLGS